jgi:hypothetical protein
MREPLGAFAMNFLSFAFKKKKKKKVCWDESLSDFILICFQCLYLQCRLAGLTYRGIFTADVCMQWNNGVVIRHNISYGKMPVMVKVQF